jgi:TIGR03009 family protein
MTLLTGTTLKAQQSEVLTGRSGAELGRILKNWEAAMKNIKSLSARLSRRTVDKVFQSTEEFIGTAKYMRPNLARLELYKKNKPAVYEKYVCTGTFLYAYRQQEKKIIYYELPKNNRGKIGDDNVFTFLFDMKAKDAQTRYDLTLLPAPAKDKWYYYVLIKPKKAQDIKQFSKARLVLNKTTFMPRQLWFQEPNGNTITWDFPTIVIGADLNNKPLRREEFLQPKLEKGWKFERGTENLPPRLARPKG